MESLDSALRQFLIIARAGSLSGAADIIGVTQSGLSRQLAHLETRLGQRLFRRHGRGVELTDVGRMLDDSLTGAYDLIDRTIERVRDERGLAKGKLRIAAVPPLSHYMTGVIADFMSRHPDINISLMAGSSPEVVKRVESGTADFGFVYDEAVASEDLDSTFLIDERMMLVVSRQSPLAAEQTVNLRQTKIPLVVFPAHYTLRKMLQVEGLDDDVAVEVETLDDMLKIVAITSSGCVLSDRIPLALLQDHGLIGLPIDAPVLTRRVVAISRSRRVQPDLVRLLLDIARGALGRE